MTMATVTSSEPAATSIKAQDPHFISFMATFDKIMVDLEEILSKMNVPEQGLKWFKNMFKETCVGGKMNRGLTVPSALRSILKRELSEKELFDSQVLGWLIEMVIVVYKLQAFFLIQDDIMDASITRRGKPCWYKRENVGMIAINDSIMIEMCIYQLLKHHFKSHPAYVEMMELFHDTTFQTEVGQMMDLLTAPENNVDLSKFSISRHAYIVEYKTAYYSFYLPIALAMHYAKITDPTAFDSAKSVLLPLGEYFQVQDDYLDCFGLPEQIGKIGTDIQDNKCGWLIVQALKLASPEQRAILNANYGQKDDRKVEKVKNVFQELNLEKIYQEYEEKSYHRIRELVSQVDDDQLPRQMFLDFMDRIYKRKL